MDPGRSKPMLSHEEKEIEFEDQSTTRLGMKVVEVINTMPDLVHTRIVILRGKGNLCSKRVPDLEGVQCGIVLYPPKGSSFGFGRDKQRWIL